jgi:hypothetical protein
MANVNLEDNEWSYVLGVLGERPWREANAVLMKIGTQLRMQQNQARNPDAAPRFSEQSYQRTVSPRFEATITPADRGNSFEQRPPGQEEG